MNNSVYDMVETDGGFKLALRTGIVGESDITDISAQNNEFISVRENGEDKKAVLIKIIDELKNRIIFSIEWGK